MSFLPLPFCFLATSKPPKHGEDGDRAIGDGTGMASAAAAAPTEAALRRLRVETKTDFPLRGATTAADLESPAVRRLRRSAAVAAAAAEDDDVADEGDAEAFLLNKLMLPEMARIHSTETGCVYIFQLTQTVSPSFAVLCLAIWSLDGSIVWGSRKM